MHTRAPNEPSVKSAMAEKRPRRSPAIALLLLGVFTTVTAAPSFITGSRITRGAVYSEITIRLACLTEYLDHQPTSRGERLRISLQSTTICDGVSPTIANSRQSYRPLDADDAKLIEIDYEGDTTLGQTLMLVFSEDVRFDVVNQGPSDELTIRVFPSADAIAPAQSSGSTAVRVPAPAQQELSFVVNLSSSRQRHAAAAFPALELPPGVSIFETEVVLAGVSWYRLRLGPFTNSNDAQVEAAKLHDKFPNAWIARDTDSSATVATTQISSDVTASPYSSSNPSLASVGLDEIDALMGDARRAMVTGELSRAVQIYTKVLQVPNHDRHPEALEYLALAREKNGQTAHAKAEYERYLSLYPKSEGTARVNQRLAVLVAGSQPASRSTGTSGKVASANRNQAGAWRLQTFFTQNYRLDVNQQGDQDQVTSQSALYSDVNFDARRRGERFDFSSRLSAGYRNDFLPEDEGSGNSVRVSYAYADLADAVTGLRGRVGRQSRNTGGVLGRFDGLNFGYELSERVLLNAVVGKPVYSSSSGVDSERSFYGTSVDFDSVLKNFDVGLFYIEQTIEGIQDRQAVGAEFRYFGDNQNLWGMLDYDLGYGEIASAYLQGSWRFPSRFSIHGVIDRRGSPFLSTSNAMIGQPVGSFAELAVIFSEDELIELAKDRTAASTSYSFGLSYPLSPKLQVNADASRTMMDATPASGGILATDDTTYTYFSTNVVASSLFKEGDVSIVSAQYSDSGNSRVISMTLDSRFPIGRAWRINPRLRVDRRENLSSSTYEWLYTPGLRIYYRRGQRFRIELEAGKQFSQRETTDINLDRESYFVNLGYQVFF